MLATSRPSKKAFTLIELLVVISIISVLIALLLPALSAARKAGMTSKTLSMIRQVQFSLFTYAHDNKGVLPYLRANRTDPNNNSGPFWAAVIAGNGYVSDPFVFWGPFRGTDWFGTLTFTTRENTYKNPLASNVYERTGFGVNQYIMPKHFDVADEYASHRLGDNVRVHPSNTPPSNHPSDVPTISEFFYNTFAGTPSAYIYGWNSGPRSADLFAPGGSVTRSYLDGHAASRKALDLGWTHTSETTGYWTNGNAAASRRIYWFNPD